MTKNHNYRQPAKGATDWDVPLNSNFTDLDTDVEVRDENANRSNYEPKEGAKFLGVDTGDVYLGDGSNWQYLGTISSSGTDSSSGRTDVIVADTADEIQPAIDKLASNVRDGSIRGGVVQLKQKAYYPSTTIWLKKGVVLKGATPWPHSTNSGNADVMSNASDTGTTLYTDNLPNGPAFDPDPADCTATYRHFDSVDAFKEARGEYNFDVSNDWLINNTHPHFPLVANYNQAPIYHEDDGSVSEELADTWGDGVALMNLSLKAKPGERRYWDPSNESSGSQREKNAMYYGVYDGFIFENMSNLKVYNVGVSGFRGYNAFYQDIKHVVSQGNEYGSPGTATDHHGSTLQISRSNSSVNRYMRGKWTLNVEGPTPTVKVENHADRTQFIGGGPIKPRIEGKDTVFLDSVETSQTGYGETAYENGDAPIANSKNKHDIVYQTDPWVEWSDYKIADDSNEGGKTGMRMELSQMRMTNMVINADRGLYMEGGGETELWNSTISGIETNSWQPYAVGVKIDGALKNGGRANSQGGWHGCWFGTDDNGNSLVGSSNKKVVLQNPTLDGGIQNATSDWKGNLYMANPRGWSNENGGNATVSDGDVISHGMDETPQFVTLQTQSANRAYWTTADGSEITVRVIDSSGNAVSSDETVYWHALGWSHPAMAPV